MQIFKYLSKKKNMYYIEYRFTTLTMRSRVTNQREKKRNGNFEIIFRKCAAEFFQERTEMIQKENSTHFLLTFGMSGRDFLTK